MAKIRKKELFLELANPDEYGNSRWVYASEFVGKYKELQLGNGGSWCRKEASLAKEYILEVDKTITSGNSIDAVRTAGFNEDEKGSQHISSRIKEYYKKQRCVVLGTSGPEIDHKNGRKDDLRVMIAHTQELEDFQPLSKAANDAKRQFCRECRETGKRYDAKLLGYPISFTKGGLNYNGQAEGCEGCFWYDPKQFRKDMVDLIKKL